MSDEIPLDEVGTLDLEQNNGGQFLMNYTVQRYSWKGLTVTVKDHETKKARDLITEISGDVYQGEFVALMGPSGCGKTTLLNVLARCTAAARATVFGETYVNGDKVDSKTFGRITSYVEQEDALIGSLTVRETLKFAADLSLLSTISKSERIDCIRALLEAFGIQNQAETLVGTPIRKGISGGQKRRVSVASQLITCPKILFLDEPTSGLDLTASYEVMLYAKELARSNNLLIIASIYQPSTSTFELFDKLFLLSAGKICYGGPVANVRNYFNGIGFPVPVSTNPAEFLLDIISADFGNSGGRAVERVRKIQSAWAESGDANVVANYCDVVAYGICIVMYLGLAIMMGTVWLRLYTTQDYIQPFINAIFFGSAFMSFMAVAYVPAFLED
ncbi:hypothetical protein CBS147326_9936 [Penicillium roqueforti]|nr:hypothetical protein CBS147326_9936 [Penicillium roqueforti]